MSSVVISCSPALRCKNELEIYKANEQFNRYTGMLSTLLFFGKELSGGTIWKAVPFAAARFCITHKAWILGDRERRKPPLECAHFMPRDIRQGRTKLVDMIHS